MTTSENSSSKSGLKLSIALVIVLCVGAGAYYYVSPNPRDQIMPQDFNKASEQFKNSIKTLPEEDKALFAKYIYRTGLAKIFGKGKEPKILTVGEAINEQKEFDLKRAQKEAEQKILKEKIEAQRKEAKDQIDSILTVALLKKEYKKIKYQDYIAITLAIENKGTKDIKGVKGVIVFKDIFDDKIKAVGFSYDDGVKAKSTSQWDGSIDYNQFRNEDQKLATTETDKIKFEFIPEVVIFSDGSKVEAPKL